METQVMIDLETLGIKHNAIICSIGAAKIDIEKLQISDTFYKVVAFTDKDGSYNHSTIKWWLGQPDKPRLAILNGVPLYEALTDFSNFYGDSIGLYGNGATFDNIILRSAYETAGISAPWSYREDKCYRTIKNLYKNVKFERTGTYHNALDDAISQAQYLIQIARTHNLAL